MENLKKNLFINISYQLFSVAIPLILAPYVGKTIGPEGAGIYSYSYSIAYCFALIGMLGIGNYGNRTIASSNNNIKERSKNFWNIWTIQIITSLISCVIYCIYVGVFNTENSIILKIQIFTVACSIFDISWFFFGIEKFQVTVIRNLIVKVLNVICVFLFVNDKSDLPIYTTIMVGSSLLNNLLLFPFLRKEVIIIQPSIVQIKKHIKPIIILFFPVIAISIYKIMDKVMIGALSTTIQTGYYEYAEKIIGLPGVVITAIGSVMLPRLSVLVGEKNDEKVQYLIKITMEIMMFLAFGMSWGIFAISYDFIPIFFGDEFVPSVEIMMGLAPSVIFQAWANVIRTQYLIPKKKDTVYVQSAWMGAIVNLVCNAILIPKFEAIGAVIGTVIAEFSVAFYQTYKVRDELPIGIYIKNCWFYIVPSILMVIVIKIISQYIVEKNVCLIILEILVGSFVYVLVSGLYVFFKLKIYKRGK